MNAPRFLRALLAVVPVLGLAACDRQAGTSDEHETTVAARLYQPDGTPASGARIRIYAVADTSKLPRDQVFASSDGSVFLPTGLPEGEYNLVVSDGDGNGLVIDSLLSKGAGAPELRSDTLRPMGILTGRLQVEPQHSPRIAWVQILGTGLAANVDTSGNFRLEVPAGKVTLAARTLESQYTPTFRAIRTIPDSVLNIGTVRLEYTGIPVVEGLTVSYDTLNAVATVRWNRATMPGLRGYEVYRNGLGSVAIDDLSDTVFHDTLYRPVNYDDQRKTRDYSVVAVDSARKPGLAWRWVDLDVPSPWTVPRPGFRIDTTFRIELPENACDVIDTAAGHLVCIRERSAKGFDLAYLHTSDTAEVRVSRDGVAWTLLPIPGGGLRAVVWNDRIWVLRGIADGTSGSVPNIYDPSRMLTSPLYAGVRIEVWTLDGDLEHVDTILDRKSAWMYRLVVVADTMLLSRDSAALGGTANGPGSIYVPYSLGVRKLSTPKGTWTEEVRGEGFDLSELLVADMSMGMYPYEIAKAEWQGAQWIRQATSPRPGLYLRRSNEAFPWNVGVGMYNRKHRGNGFSVPPFVIWKGCALIQGTSRIHGVCPEN